MGKSIIIFKLGDEQVTFSFYVLITKSFSTFRLYFIQIIIIVVVVIADDNFP